MEPEVFSSPLHLTDTAGGRGPTTAVGEEEPTVNLSDMLEHQLLLGFHPEVPTELTAPADKIGGQEDGGWETRLLGQLVNLLQVGLHHLVRQEGQSHSRELK